MFDIISIGAATTDIFIKSAELLENKRFLSLKRSSKNEISEFLICSGGGATNSATTFSRLGLKTSLISLIGDDPLSEYIQADLINEKINRTAADQPGAQHHRTGARRRARQLPQRRKFDGTGC